MKVAIPIQPPRRPIVPAWLFPFGTKLWKRSGECWVVASTYTGRYWLRDAYWDGRKSEDSGPDDARK